MATKLEYLKHCVVNGQILRQKRWYVTCFAIPVLKDESDWESNKTPYRIVTKPDGLYFVSPTNDTVTLEKIDDFKRNEALLDFQTFINVDNTWLPSIPGKAMCKIGVLVFNAMVIYESVKDKLGFINPSTPENDIKIKPSDVESVLAAKVKNDDELKPGDITVKEMVRCTDNMAFLEEIALLINVASTPKAITPPPGIEKIRKDLAKEYEGQLDDPIKVVEMQSKLDAIDNEYLADDIAAKNIFNKKAKTGRAKLYLMYGNTNDFVETDENRIVVQPLSGTVDVSPENFPKYMNDLRFASYSRGASTALSGYSYKILQRSLAGLSISDKPCDTKTGFMRTIDKGNYKKLVNRYILDKGWLLVQNETQAKDYVGKTLTMRSAMHCKSPGNTVCYACMGELYKNTPNGVTNLAATISSVLMNQFLKLMHGGATETADVVMADLVS